MEILQVLAAAAASWVFGAIWYMALAKPWMAAAGVPVGPDGRPAGASAAPFILSAVMMVVVAGMLRHVLATGGVATIGAGTVSGLGVGAFFITPWIAINNAYGMRPVALTIIDGGYAILGCAIMGAVLTAW